MMRKKLIVLLASIFGIASCSLPGFSIPDVPQVLNIACVGDFENLEPCGDNPPPEEFVRQVYECLTGFDENFNVIPALAKSWEIVDGRLVMHLSDAKFSDGSVLGSGDVIRSFENLSKTDQSWIVKNVTGYTLFAQGRSSSIMGIEEIDQSTISISTSDNIEYFLKKLANPRAAIWKMNNGPIGTGAFCIKKFIPGSKIMLQPNPYSITVPMLTQINFMIRVSNQAAFEDYRQGRVAIAPVSEDMLLAAQNESHSSISTFDNYSFLALGFNCKSGFASSQAARQTVASCIDSMEINDKVFYNAHRGLITPDQAIKRFRLDKHYARLALPESLASGLGQVLANQIQNCSGLKVDVVAMSDEDYVNSVLNGSVDMFVFGVMQNTPDDYETLSLPLSNAVLAKGLSYDVTVLAKILKESTTSQNRPDQLSKASDLLKSEMPFVKIIGLKTCFIVNDSVRDFKPGAWGGKSMSSCSIGR